MQRTITEQTAPTTEQAEPEILRLVRADSRIRSVAIITPAKSGSLRETHEPVKTNSVESPTLATGSFLVTDLLEDITYLVGQHGSLSKLVITMKDEQVTVLVQPGSDLIEIAHDFVIHLATIMAHN